jgi:hypothetical protein
MAQLRFTHPKISDPLVVETGANEIVWSYSLNVATYPTYAGEVVQVLSTYIDNLQIVGDLRSYEEMETVYEWFLRYIQLATQGQNGFTDSQVGVRAYNEDPVIMEYPHRGWRLSIHPMQLPGFRMGTEVVVPQWQLVAAVSETDDNIEQITMQAALEDKLSAVDKEGFNALVKLKGEVGYRESNPFSDPTARPDGSKGKKSEVYDPKQAVEKAADWFNNLIPSYLNHDFDALLGSKPASNASSDPSSTQIPANKK